GAALLVDDGRSVVAGCNVENASFGLSICAERNAVGAMVADGFRRPLAIAVVGEPGVPCYPCGACRQYLAEFNIDLLV
ncbi:MAG TPA: cytidine deaminase, partial [Synergistaceae bacterium]|nr:cytidine deaminase [Synergistaceae bacterium]